MIFPVKADLIGMIKGTIQGLRPFAVAHEVELSLNSEFKELFALYQPEQIVPDLTQLISRIITFTPQKHSVNIAVKSCPANQSCILISITNSGVNLSLLGDIRSSLRYPVEVSGYDRGSNFELQFPLDLDLEKSDLPDIPRRGHTIIKPWYSEIRKRLTNHFSDPKTIERAARNRSDQEGIFLTKANAIIYSRLEQEGFGAEDLARSMALSRTQLFRKIRDLTQMAPGRYIRFIKLQKAKELLEKGDLNVNEVAYQVGFVSHSHFTRAFQKQFGMNPSALK